MKNPNKKIVWGGVSQFLNKDIKELNGVILSLFVIIFLVTVGVISYKINSSYAVFTDSVSGEKVIEISPSFTTEFAFKEEAQEYIVPKDGWYFIEMAGASGGGPNTSYGAKTSGYIYLEMNEKLYFYVGQKGTDGGINCRTSGYEFNGGGIAKPLATNVCGTAGGGATDVRLVNGTWSNTDSLISRIMVAGAGGGSTVHVGYTQGFGGSIYGGMPIFSTYQANLGKPGTQISGGAAPTIAAGAISNGTAGSFGKGGYGGANNTYGGGAGGGGGYYGGSGSSGLSGGYWPGGGGSSYISGYAGVNSVTESTTITHTNQTLHYSNKYFIDGKMIEGQNSGNGYAKITYVKNKPKKKTTKLDNVRYIKDCSNYNSANSENHWIEIQAIKDGINKAKGKTVTGTTANHTSYPYTRITDGDITFTNYAGPNPHANNQCVTVDLGSVYNLDEVAVWNYFGDQRVYYDNITYVSSDNSTWTQVIDEATVQSSNGRRINAYEDNINGYIQDNLVLWYDGYANTGTTRNHTTTAWKDLSGTGNNVTISGATWHDQFLSFDGTNDYAYKTSGAVYNISKEHTIEVLLKPQKIDSSYQMIFNTINTGVNVDQYGSLWISSGNEIGYNTGNGSSNYITTRFDITSSDVNKYFLLTGTRKDRNYKIYNFSTLMKNFDFDFDARTPNPGIYVGGSAYYFKGYVYSIRVYNKTLTEEEIMHNYLYDKQKFHLE